VTWTGVPTLAETSMVQSRRQVGLYKMSPPPAVKMGQTCLWKMMIGRTCAMCRLSGIKKDLQLELCQQGSEYSTLILGDAHLCGTMDVASLREFTLGAHLSRPRTVGAALQGGGI
jgi:hypothetical protein